MTEKLFTVTLRINQPTNQNPKFQASNHLLWLYSPVSVRPDRKPRTHVFSQHSSIKLISICLTDTSTVKKKKGPPDRHKVLIIVGVNVGILLVAGVIGMMCYNKRKFQGPYHKVPGRQLLSCYVRNSVFRSHTRADTNQPRQAAS